MKQLQFAFLAFFAVVTISCSKSDYIYDPDNKPTTGVITLQVHIEELPSEIRLSIGNGSGYNWPFGLSVITYPPISIGSTNSDRNVPNETPDDLEIDWGDGSATHMTSHTYERRGVHTVTIKGTGIKVLNCEYNNITSINVSKCPNIEALILSPEIKVLDITNNPHLISLSWSPASQASLNLSKCPKLEHLNLGSNIQNLSIRDCPMIQRLEYSGNFTELDLSSHPLLRYLKISGQFTAIDLDKCPELQYLSCGSPNLTTLKIENCKKLRYIGLGDSKIESLALDGYSQLSWLESSSKSLKRLSIKNSFTDTQEPTAYINCSGGFEEYSRLELTEIGVTNCPHLRMVRSIHGKLTEVRLQNCIALEQINVADNQLVSISIVECENYKNLNIAGNLFTDSALNAVYNNLPTYETNPSPTGSQPSIYIEQNSGTGDTSIATSKGWRVVM